MYTQPSIADLVRSVMTWLQRDIASALTETRAQMNLQMALAVLQWVIQRVERDPELLVIEHNEMAALYRELAAMFDGTPGAAAERLHARAAALGRSADLPPPPAAAVVNDAHHRLSEGLIATLSDLDELLQDGAASASAALVRVRQHLHLRTTRDFQNLIVDPNSLAGRQ